MDIKIACAQIQVEPGNPEANTRKALDAITRARGAQVDILLLPELMVPGYLLGDLWEQSAFLRDCEAWGKEIIAASEGICVIFGNIATDPDKVNEDGRIRKYNAAFVAQDRPALSFHQQDLPAGLPGIRRQPVLPQHRQTAAGTGPERDHRRPGKTGPGVHPRPGSETGSTPVRRRLDRKLLL